MSKNYDELLTNNLHFYIKLCRVILQGKRRTVINSAILSIKSEILPLFITSYFLLITSYSLLLTPYSAYTLNLDAFALGDTLNWI